MSIYYITNDSIDNFNTMHKLKCVGIEDKILTEEELKQQNKVELYKDTTTYENDNPFIGYPIRQDNTIRPATRVELINLKLDKLEDGEYIEGSEVKIIHKPAPRYKWVLSEKKWIPDETLLVDGEYVEKDKIIEVPVNPEMLKPKWNKELHVWEEQATSQEISLHEARAQLDEYSVLDTPLTFEDMEAQGILVEYKAMMKELKEIIITLSESQASSEISGYASIVLPKPSKNLIDFKNKFSKLF